jgi:hypothetical protein
MSGVRLSYGEARRRLRRRSRLAARALRYMHSDYPSFAEDDWAEVARLDRELSDGGWSH